MNIPIRTNIPPLAEIRSYVDAAIRGGKEPRHTLNGTTATSPFTIDEYSSPEPKIHLNNPEYSLSMLWGYEKKDSF